MAVTLLISSVNVTKSAENLLAFAKAILNGKTFFVQCCFGQTQRLMNKKSSLFAYVFVVNCSSVQITPAAYVLQSWKLICLIALKILFDTLLLDINPWVFKWGTKLRRKTKLRTVVFLTKCTLWHIKLNIYI